MRVSARTPQELREKLDKVQALYDGAKTPGEKAACKAAIERLEESLRHYGQNTSTRKNKKRGRPEEDSETAERLRREWAKEWSATFTPGHTQPNPSFTSALHDYLNEFFEGRPETSQFHGKRASKAAYPNAYK